MNPSFISLIGILFGILGANSIFLWKKKQSLGVTGNSIVGVFSSVLFIKIIGRIFHLKSESSFLLILTIFVGAFIIGLTFVFLTKEILLKLNVIK